MSVPLESLASCLQGLLPAQLFTCSAAGTPNVAYLSHIEYVDSRHVALSYQFFNKSRRNVTENPNALVIVIDPDSGQGWGLRLRYERSETSGPLFDRMALRIQAIASFCGLSGVFKLRAADVYEVLAIEPVAEESGATFGRQSVRGQVSATPDPVFTLRALQDLAEHVQRADSLERLVDAILGGLAEGFGLKHSMLLVPGEEEGTLVAIATHGYAENGAGVEVRFGEGIAGVVAEARKPIRISGLMRGALYALAMHRETVGAGGRERPRIPYPGLANPESQLGVPLLVRDELVGVLCLESEKPYRFHEEDRASIELLGSYLAIAIQNVQLHERANDAPGEAVQPAGATAGAPKTAPPRPPGTTRHELVYYDTDECILVDGEYLVRSLPAKILWRLLTAWAETGRTEFTNRELRLDKSLNLPEWKDNLESRLLLLRRRLEQRCPDLRILPRCRGRFMLEVQGDVSLATRP